MNIALLSFILLAGIGIIKTAWILTDTTPLRKASKKELLKSNSIEFVILILQAIAAIYFPLPHTSFDTIIVITGIILYIIGLFFAIWGRLSLHDTWGHPGKQVTKFQKKLITDKAFSISRNPIYIGFLFIFFGYAIAIRSVLIILRIPLLFYFYRSILAEEKLLNQQFGSKYNEYMKRVPRFLFI